MKFSKSFKTRFADDPYQRNDANPSYQATPKGPTGGGDFEFQDKIEDNKTMNKGEEPPVVDKTSVQPQTDLRNKLIETKDYLNKAIEGIKTSYALAVKTNHFSAPDQQSQLGYDLTRLIRRINVVVQAIDDLHYRASRD